MRHRITYIRDARHGNFSPDNIQVSDSSLNVRRLVAAKEHRLTMGLSEIPDEITSVLEQCHELHIRWTSPRYQALPPPLSSRVSSGLHVFFTPRENKNTDLICPMLRNVFAKELKCSSQKESFTAPPLLSTRFSTTASSQLYSYVSSLDEFVIYIQQQICRVPDQNCQALADLVKATSLDIDYDVISRVLVIAASWNHGPDDGGEWNESILKSKKDDKVEIGILHGEQTSEAEELRLGGWLTVIGDDEKPKPTLFSFPSRHHPLPSSFYTMFDKPAGLHPTLRIAIHHPQRLEPPNPSCALHAYLTLPSTLFLDRHAFSDPLFLSSHNLVALRSVSGATDLEAPEWLVPQWGSAVLFQLSTPSSPSAAQGDADAGADADADAKSRKQNQQAQQKGATHEITIPLHARYLAPAAGGHSNTTTPWPAVFWACAAEQGAKFPVNPFDRRELGYDGLFGDRTLFYHLQPAEAGGGLARTTGGVGGAAGRQEGLVCVLGLPVLDLNGSAAVEVGTVGAVVGGFLWVCWMLFRPLARGQAGGSRK